MRVKICGLRDQDGARACVAAGVDLVGLNFVPSSRRCITETLAAELLPVLGGVEAVGVFADQPVGEVLELSRRLGLRTVQLHGGESPADCAAVAEHLDVVKAVDLRQVEQPGLLDALAPHVSALLVDGRRPGSGQAWDWVALRRHCRPAGRLAGVPLWLAGGLDEGNVGEAIAALQPAVVDTASGVEERGTWSTARVVAFCRQARAAAAALEAP